jgi:class 3 adenylate cyclase
LAAGERRLGAKMFTDLVGYSAFTSRDEGRALKLLEENRTFLLAAFQKHGDVVVKAIGDGFLPYLRGFPCLARYRSGPRWSAIDSELGPS